MIETRNELKSIQVGDVLIYRPKPKKIFKNQKFLRFQQWIQRPWLAQTLGLENASHAAICVGHDDNGFPKIVLATSRNNCHMQSMIGDSKVPAWANDKWSIVAFRLQQNKIRKFQEEKVQDQKKNHNVQQLIHQRLNPTRWLKDQDGEIKQEDYTVPFNISRWSDDGKPPENKLS